MFALWWTTKERLQETKRQVRCKQDTFQTGLFGYSAIRYFGRCYDSGEHIQQLKSNLEIRNFRAHLQNACKIRLLLITAWGSKNQSSRLMSHRTQERAQKNDHFTLIFAYTAATEWLLSLSRSPLCSLSRKDWYFSLFFFCRQIGGQLRQWFLNLGSSEPLGFDGVVSKVRWRSSETWIKAWLYHSKLTMVTFGKNGVRQMLGKLRKSLACL